MTVTVPTATAPRPAQAGLSLVTMHLGALAELYGRLIVLHLHVASYYAHFLHMCAVMLHLHDMAGH